MNNLKLIITETSDGSYIWSSPLRNVFSEMYRWDDSRYYDECAGNGVIDSMEGDFFVVSNNCLKDMQTFISYGWLTWHFQLNLNKISSSRVQIHFGSSNLVCDLQKMPPAIPTDLKVSVDKDIVKLTWTDASSDETAFAILRKDGDGDWTEIGTVAANATTFSEPLTAGAHSYRVKSRNTVGDSLGSNVVVVGK